MIPKLLCLALVTTLPTLAAERWFELRVSPTHGVTNYTVPAGKVVQIMAFDAPAKSVLYSMSRPEGEIDSAEVSNQIATGAYMLGPGKMTMHWTGWVDSRVGFHFVLLREFDAEPQPVAPVIHLTLEATTNAPNFGPASALFRAKQN